MKEESKSRDCPKLGSEMHSEHGSSARVGGSSARATERTDRGKRDAAEPWSSGKGKRVGPSLSSGQRFWAKLAGRAAGSFLLRAPGAQAWLGLDRLTCPWGNNPKVVGEGTPGGIPALKSHCEQLFLLFITLLSLNKFLFFYNLFYIFKKLL